MIATRKAMRNRYENENERERGEVRGEEIGTRMRMREKGGGPWRMAENGTQMKKTDKQRLIVSFTTVRARIQSRFPCK